MLVIFLLLEDFSHGAEQPSVGRDEAGTLRHYEAQTAVGTSGYDYDVEHNVV